MQDILSFLESVYNKYKRIIFELKRKKEGEMAAVKKLGQAVVSLALSSFSHCHKAQHFFPLKHFPHIFLELVSAVKFVFEHTE